MPLCVLEPTCPWSGKDSLPMPCVLPGLTSCVDSSQNNLPYHILLPAKLVPSGIGGMADLLPCVAPLFLPLYVPVWCALVCLYPRQFLDIPILPGHPIPATGGCSTAYLCTCFVVVLRFFPWLWTSSILIPDYHYCRLCPSHTPNPVSDIPLMIMPVTE